MPSRLPQLVLKGLVFALLVTGAATTRTLRADEDTVQVLPASHWRSNTQELPELPSELPSEAVGSGLRADATELFDEQVAEQHLIQHPMQESLKHSTCGSCGHCNACRSGMYLQADYLLWWLKGNRLPAMVTTSPNATPADETGVLGFSGTQVLHGDDRVDENYRHGVRLRLGYWLNPCTAIEGHWFSVGDGANTGNFFAQSAGDPLLARPFFNLNTGEDSLLVAYPGIVDGSIQMTTQSELHSAGALLRHNLLDLGGTRIDWLGGYRYLRFRESFMVTDNLVSRDISTGVAAGTQFDIYDQFTTENDFHGGEIGLATTVDYGCWNVDVLTKLAIGNMHQQLQINGNSVVTAAGGNSASTPGGLLALPTNIGSYERNDFALLPELNVNLQYRWNDCVRLTAGYSLVYVTDIMRTGDQIDRVINPTQLPLTGGGLVGAPRPGAPQADTSLWAQGLNLGVVFER